MTTFKVVVKNGDTKSKFNSERGAYEYEKFDYHSDHETFVSALEEFLGWVNDEYLDHKVSLIIKPEHEKSKKKW